MAPRLPLTQSLSRSVLGCGLIIAALTLPRLAAASMDVTWNPGASDCARDPQPPLQAHHYDARTVILRENPCVTYEAPFMYLLIGNSRALLIDTGNVADASIVPLAKTVTALLTEAGAPSLPLLVAHTHGHHDHRDGDSQFGDRPNTVLVGTRLAEVIRYFHFDRWPDASSAIDLGGRLVDVLATPGHHEAELSYYDRSTALFFSGDFLLPGRLLIEDAPADLASARHVAQFIAPRPVSFVLGGHIELDESGRLFLGEHYHPHERPLQLKKEDLLVLPDIVAHFNGFYGRQGDYVLENQNRVLTALAAASLVVLIAAVLAARTGIRRWRRARVPSRAGGGRSWLRAMTRTRP